MLNVSYNAERIRNCMETLQRGALTRKDVILNRATANFAVIDGVLTTTLDMPQQPSGAIVPEMFSINPTAQAQLASSLGIPGPYLKRLIETDGWRDLGAMLLREHCQRDPKRVMFRCMGERLRAVLSDRYQDIDNLDVLAIVAELVEKHRWSVWDLRYSDDGGMFKIVVVDPRAEVELGGDAPGHHRVRRFATVYPMVTVSNSETGHGSCRLDWGAIDGGCANGLLFGQLMAQNHLGIKHNDDGLVEWSNERRRAKVELVTLTARDLLVQGMDQDRFCERLQPVEERMNQELGEPTKVIENLGKLGVTEGQQEALQRLMLQTGHPLETRWDLQWGLTALANPEHRGELSDAEVSDLEVLGGRVLVDDEAFAQLVTV